MTINNGTTSANATSGIRKSIDLMSSSARRLSFMHAPLDSMDGLTAALPSLDKDELPPKKPFTLVRITVLYACGHGSNAIAKRKSTNKALEQPDAERKSSSSTPLRDSASMKVPLWQSKMSHAEIVGHPYRTFQVNARCERCQAFYEDNMRARGEAVALIAERIAHRRLLQGANTDIAQALARARKRLERVSGVIHGEKVPTASGVDDEIDSDGLKRLRLVKKVENDKKEMVQDTAIRMDIDG